MPAHQITRMDNGRVSDNGQLVTFEAHTLADEVLQLEIPTNEIGNLVAFLCGLAQVATHKSGAGPPPKVYKGPLIEAVHLGFGDGRTPHEKVLSASIGPFAIGIAVPTRQLADLREALQSLDLQTDHRTN